MDSDSNDGGDSESTTVAGSGVDNDPASSRESCRYPTCGEPARTSTDDGAADAFAEKFCSTMCELKYDHVKADAEDARQMEREEAGGEAPIGGGRGGRRWQ